MLRYARNVAIVAAAAGGPYVATETEMGRDAVSTVTQTFTSDGTTVTTVSAGDDQYGSHALHQVEQLRRQDPSRYRYDAELAVKLQGGEQTGYAPTLTGNGIQDIRDVLRFDITPEWVTSQFSRVGTVLADLRLEGMRVPLVSGTRPQDIAGTMTYYFDHSRRLQRVTLHGFTGDPTTMIATMTQHYGLAIEPTLDAGVYTKRWNGRPVHFFRLSRAPVVYSDAVHQKYTVFLELNQPDLPYGISPEAQKIVAADRGNGRW